MSSGTLRELATIQVHKLGEARQELRISRHRSTILVGSLLAASVVLLGGFAIGLQRYVMRRIAAIEQALGQMGVSVEDIVERFVQLVERELLIRARQDPALLDHIGGLFRACGEAAQAPLVEAICELIRSLDASEAVAPLAWRAPLASASLRGVEFKRELFASGELVSASPVAQRLHVSPSCVAQTSAQRRLLGLPDPTHDESLGFPAWQLEEPVLSQLATLWAAVPELGVWEMWFFLTSKDPGLRELAPLEVLRGHTDTRQDMGRLAELLSGRDPGDLVEATARRYAAATSCSGARRVVDANRRTHAD